MTIQRLRRALTSSSQNSTLSSTTTSSAVSSTSSTSTDLSFSFPSTHDLPLLSRSPNTPNTSKRDVFPDSPFHISPALIAATPVRAAPAAPAKRLSRTKTFLSNLSFKKREIPHPAEKHLKPADPAYVAVLEAWGGFGQVNDGRSLCGEVSPMGSRRNSFCE